ncbi:SGT1 protein-domain-containing protein [Lentinula aciculospora]|uniref:SGT1 protein-domain-containing protein n=1 Tax=Lentinula aciculospora TaxID=153920 RepID=A0A9W9DMH6_9AGAR|nr:SGT1 protein-domain-containing protein [Lentinula aciculospora]
MEIFNRIPAISEDTLKYTIYPPEELVDYASTTTLAASIQTYAESLLPSDFLWHRDAFEVKVVSDPNSDTQKYILEGHMRVGDCVDDEWCTVWLLKEMSAKWDVAISVVDSDGDFLLIEAANVLPRWVKPTNSENRVWILNSRLHLVDISHLSPPSRKPRRRQRISGESFGDDGDDLMEEQLEDYLAVEDALKLIKNPNIDTFAPPAVERIISNRISGYPDAARQHVHATKAYMPLDIAKALSVNPSLVQKATEAFYTRDGVQLRAAHRMSRFPPDTFGLTTVRLTRTAYAQLVGQKFWPPKIFGRWHEREGTRDWRWRDIGMKIAVGFEILYQENKGHSEINTSLEGLRASAEVKKDALRRNPDYNKYIENLSTAGYFKREMQGSQLWTELEDKAAEIFVNTRKEDSSTRPSFTTLVNASISQASNDFEPPILDEDDDDWLNIDAESFEDMMQRAPGTDETKQTDAMDVDQKSVEHTTSTQASQLRNLASKVEEFIGGMGDVEGARFADEMISDEEMDEESSDDGEALENDSEARQVAMDNLVLKLDPLEYGKMPASFHSNSQRVGPSIIETEAPNTEKPQTSPGTSKPIRQPIIPRDTYDGVDSDDETDEENAEEDSESEEDKPQVVGDIEIDMGEEQDEFLEFSRQALGISDTQWKEILEERKTRGAFVPNVVSPPINLPTVEKPPAHKNANGAPESGPNANLDSFEAVMKAMEDELHRSGSSLSSNSTSKKSPDTQAHKTGSGQDKGKGKTVSFADDSSDDENVDIEAAIEAELKAALEQGDDVDEDGLGTAAIDYNLIKNFLESLKSQAGLSGPVSNLAGRLQPGWQIPKDI